MYRRSKVIMVDEIECDRLKWILDYFKKSNRKNKLNELDNINNES